MTARFVHAQVGDKVYCRLYGEGVIKRINASLIYGIIVRYTKQSYEIGYNVNGKCNEYYEEPTLFYVDGDNKYATERPKLRVPWDKVPVDTKVKAFLDECDKYPERRYYAGLPKKTFTSGYTSWSNATNCNTIWYKLSLAEPITIDGITYPEGSE